MSARVLLHWRSSGRADDGTAVAILVFAQDDSLSAGALLGRSCETRRCDHRRHVHQESPGQSDVAGNASALDGLVSMGACCLGELLTFVMMICPYIIG